MSDALKMFAEIEEKQTEAFVKLEEKRMKMELEAEEMKGLQMREEREKEREHESRLFAMITQMLGARPVDMMQYGSSGYQY